LQIPEEPPVGHVIAYQYLWLSQADIREDGAKTYPCAVIMAAEIAGPVKVAYVLGISHTPPRESERALQVPLKLKKFLGLDGEPSWIYTDQLNVFAWPGPDLRPGNHISNRPSAKENAVIGPLPSDWFEMLKAHLIESQQLQALTPIKRTE
jgi:hypothetical protein